MAHKTVEFETLVEKMMKEWRVPGLSIAVIQGDEIHAKSYGVASLPDRKCTEEALFDLASCSKTMTAAAVACLVHDEKYPDVQWTTPVSKILPDDFVLADPEYTRNVTIEDILTHRSGFPSHDASYLGVRAKHPDNAKSMTRNLRNLPLNQPIRSTYQYCNIMYTVATHLVETVSGERYADFLQSRLWEPLGMANTFHDLPGLENDAAKERLVTGHRWDKEKEEYVALPSFPQPEGQGAGCIFSSAQDYAKWVRALIKRDGPISKSAHRELVTPRTIVPVKEEDQIAFYCEQSYALGLIVESYRGRKVIGHDGAVSGFSTLIRYIPEFDWGVVVLGNSSSAYEANQTLAHVLMDHVLGVPEKERMDWAQIWRESHKKAEADAEEDEKDPEFQIPEHPEPLGVELEALAGTYFNPGYKGLVVEFKDGKLVADLDDRCCPWLLTFTHLSGKTFLAQLDDIWEGETEKLKAEIQLGEGGQVDTLGVEFEPDMKGHPIWFTKLD